jgi:hypothetical protein
VSNVGKRLETTKDRNKLKTIKKYFQEIQKLSEGNSGLSTRLRFMLKDLVDLRSNRYVPRRKEEQAAASQPRVVCLRKSKSLLHEYLWGLEELKSPGYHREFVREAINLVLEKEDSDRDLVVNLIVELATTFKQLTPAQNAKGFADMLEFIEDLAIDIPETKP